MNGLARRLMHARAGLLVPLRVRRAVPASELGVRYDRPLVLVEAEPAQGDSAAPPRLALSFAPGIRAGAALRPETVIGWLSDMPAAGGQIDPKLFTGNAEFERLLNAVLSEHIHEDRGAQALAQHQKEGFLNINDERVFSPWGRVSDPEDILGTVLLLNGKIQSGTFQPMPAHRLLSSNGLFQLSDFMHERLVERCTN